MRPVKPFFFSHWPFELTIGWRYTRAARSASRNGFISFISGVSMLGIALGVAALIIVLSVMNGFQKEVRERMLSVVSHIELLAPSDEGLDNTAGLIQQARQHPEVTGAAPFVAQQALLARGEDMKGALVRGIDPVAEAEVSDFLRDIPSAAREALQAGAFNVILGTAFARDLGVLPGDRITLMAPGGQVTPAGVMPRVKQLTVVGVFDSGHYEFDANMALLHIDDAQRIFKLNAPTGVRLKIKDSQQARRVAADLMMQLGPDVIVRDWTRQNRTWFAAVQVEKRMMFIILTLIVAVAAFNLVTTLVMTVTDKRADIAILRTLGASPRSIMSIFVVQGATVGVLGTLGGLLMGLGVAFHIDVIVPAIEAFFGASFLPQDIYLISRMPSDPQAADIWPITLISLALAFVATLYPSWRASRIHPAEALRYE